MILLILLIECISYRPQQSMIAFKLVWCPPLFEKFVLVDDDGALLNWGKPKAGSDLPNKRYRMENYQLTQGSKYSIEAELCGRSDNTTTTTDNPTQEL